MACSVVRAFRISPTPMKRHLDTTGREPSLFFPLFSAATHKRSAITSCCDNSDVAFVFPTKNVDMHLSRSFLLALLILEPGRARFFLFAFDGCGLDFCLERESTAFCPCRLRFLFCCSLLVCFGDSLTWSVTDVPTATAGAPVESSAHDMHFGLRLRH